MSYPPQPPHYDPNRPYYPYNATHVTINTPPRQSCALHALLFCTTFGIGNIAYAIWHNHHHAR
jgi:hypothetical protein